MRLQAFTPQSSWAPAIAGTAAAIPGLGQTVEVPIDREPGASAPLRVLFFNHTAAPGGAEIAMLNLVRHLDARKITPLVVFGSDGPIAQQMRRSAETHVLSLPVMVSGAKKDGMGVRSALQLRIMFAALAYVWKLGRLIRQTRPDFVHTNSLKAHLLGGFAARLSGTPVVWHLRNSVDSGYLPSPVVRAAFRALARSIPEFVIACSGATLRSLEPATGAKDREVPPSRRKRRSAVVHDGTPSPPPSLAASSSPNDGNFRIGLIGRISPWKGQDVFIRAAAVVRQAFPHTQFYIVGSALFGEETYEREVRELAESYGIPGLVTFTGFRKDVLSVIAGMDLIVHASTIGEPFGLVIIEGMAAGKPVIATNGGGVPEIVECGKTGILVPMGDVTAMAAAMNRLIANRRLAAEMGARGRQRVLNRFTIQHTARKVEDIYASLTAERTS